MVDVVWNDDQIVNLHLSSSSSIITHLAFCHRLRICEELKRLDPNFWFLLGHNWLGNLILVLQSTLSVLAIGPVRSLLLLLLEDLLVLLVHLIDVVRPQVL